MTEISGKAALVTGGGSGIGRAICFALAEEKARVVVADIVAESAEAVAAQIRAAGGEAIAICCDVSDRAAVRAMKAEANRAFGDILLLFPIAGAFAAEPINGISDEHLDWMIEVNFMGVVNLVHVFLPDMVAAGDGHILGAGSACGLLPSLVENCAPYSAAKAGVMAFLMNLRRELAGTGVQSTTFCIASVDTGGQNASKYRPDRFGGAYDDWVVMPASFKRGYPRPPSEAAEMAILAVKENRPILTSDPEYRAVFQQQVVDLMLGAFDDVDRFYAAKRAESPA